MDVSGGNDGDMDSISKNIVVNTNRHTNTNINFNKNININTNTNKNVSVRNGKILKNFMFP